MAATASTMLPLGTKAPDFKLPDTKGNIISLSDFEAVPALLVIFMCNHCPYVKHILDGMIELIKEYQDKGVAVVGINSNDVADFPEDAPERMAGLAKQKGFTFPYLFDETQQVAKAYHAACTPDFFLFDKDLSAAIDALLQNKQPPAEQKPSLGCNIKWKSGNEPDYF
jgi:peroxiredoxin